MAKAATAAKAPQPRELAPAAMLHLADLVVNPRNPRKHGEDQIQRLMASLVLDGQTKPVLLRKANSMLIAGHGIAEAMRRLRWTHINALLWDVDQATADRVMLADNRLSDLSTSDAAAVAELLQGVSSENYLATGYSADEVEKLLAGIEEDIEVIEVETSAVMDDFWISVRGPLPRQAMVLQRIKQLLAEFTEVSVELGTVGTGA